jgi:hypothetical protein
MDKIFQMEGLIELKNNFNKKTKSKEWGSNWKKKQQKIWLNDEIERKKTSKKNVKDKIRNLKNKDWNEKSSIWENCNWMIKLKRIKISINEKGTK